MEAHSLGMGKVKGSTPFISTNYRSVSSVVERFPDTEEVSGSTPLSNTILKYIHHWLGACSGWHPGLLNEAALASAMKRIFTPRVCFNMVYGVCRQVVRPRVVIPICVGSIPIRHPNG